MFPFDDASTGRGPAFDPPTRALLAAAPASAWAADISVATCLALLTALHESFIVGRVLYTARQSATVVDPAAIVACDGIHAALAACPPPEPHGRDHLAHAFPRADTGFSDEFVRTWIDKNFAIYKHTKWIVRLTAEALQGVLAAIDHCPPPSEHPSMYDLVPLARALTAQRAIHDITRGAVIGPDELANRTVTAMQRASKVMQLGYTFADEFQPRLERELGHDVATGRVLELLFDALAKFRGNDYDAYVARAHQHIAVFRATPIAELAGRLVLAPR